MEGEELLNNDIINELKREERQMACLESRLSENLEHAPEGSLRVNGTAGRKTQFYQYISENRDMSAGGIYLGKDKYDVAKKLAQKGYDAKMLEWAKRVEYRLKNLIDCYEHNTPEIIYNNLSNIKQEMVDPYYVPDDVFLENWLDKWVCDKNTYIRKIEEYALSGYTLGDGLLATFETNGNIFDTRYLDALVNRYLK